MRAKGRVQKVQIKAQTSVGVDEEINLQYQGHGEAALRAYYIIKRAARARALLAVAVRFALSPNIVSFVRFALSSGFLSGSISTSR